MGRHLHPREPGEAEILQTRGAVWNWASRYDLLMWVATLGRERTVREQMAQVAQLDPSEEVLDVGCGTGTLAIIAQGDVCRAGRVVGIDHSRQMIAQARRKAKRAPPRRTPGGGDRAVGFSRPVVCCRPKYLHAAPFT
jgi:demethylmenaquinone methyltransferase/2-methoxy-6-polyprenyl-1,4-benzoquinol methylase/phosphoethanolamine N-methyltransferase